MLAKPPLHVHLLFHPKSQVARELTDAILPEWMAPPGVQGTRVPIFLTPDDGTGQPPAELDLDAAKHSLVIVLVDRDMVRRVNGQGAQWAVFVRDLVLSNPPGARHRAVPVALDSKAFNLDSAELGQHHFLPLDRISDPERRLARVNFLMSVQGLQLLRSDKDGARAGGDGKTREAPIMVFASHAKRNLDPDRQDPVGFTQRSLIELPVREWFDAREIPEGGRFDAEIRAGIERSDSMLVFQTDDWSSRPWCRDEAVMAKQLQTPTVVVNALREGEKRSFPYSGNTRLLHWGVPLDPPPDADELRAWQKASEAQGERAIAAAVHIAMRRQHARSWLEGLSRPGDIVLDVEPEAARLAWETEADATFFYPDPPLSATEISVLQGLRPAAKFETPMTRFANRRSGAGLPIAVSISESPDLARRGLTMEHQRRLVDEVHLYLLLARLRIIYGGKLDPDKLADPDNFTLRLFSLARTYSQLARDAGAGDLQPIINAAPWPLWKLYDDNVGDVFGTVAELQAIPLPDIGKTDADLGATPEGFVPPKSPLQLYAWARALTHMRERVTNDAAARLCIGGRLEGYKGRLAGLIEEPLLSLRSKKPLFLVGACGGCTNLVIDLLEQRDRTEMTTEVARSEIAEYDRIEAHYKDLGGEWLAREAVAKKIKKAGQNGPAEALKNGLTDKENRRLFETSDPATIAELVLRGLEELGH